MIRREFLKLLGIMSFTGIRTKPSWEDISADHNFCINLIAAKSGRRGTFVVADQKQYTFVDIGDQQRA